jgi:hypothetical protein
LTEVRGQGDANSDFALSLRHAVAHHSMHAGKSQKSLSLGRGGNKTEHLRNCWDIRHSPG